MAVIKYLDQNGNWQTVVGVVIQNEVVQTTGNSETAVMSQKTVTDELAGKLSLSGGTLSANVSSTDWVSDTGQILCNASYTNYFIGMAATNNGYAVIQGGNSGTGAIPLLLNPSHDLADNNVGIGFTSPSYLLHVAGAAAATSFVNTSDIRKKDIIENLDLDVDDIANAPIFKFSWLDPEMPEGVNVGTSAQYWKTILPELVSEAKDEEKTLSMQYGVAALASSVSLAKKVVEQENRIKALEDTIKELQNKLK